MRAYILDDLQASIDTLSYLLKTYCPEIELAGSSGDFDKAALDIRMTAIDILFLDINLGNNLTSFDLLDKLPRFNGNIIMITAYEEYALKAFKYGAVHYLLKPIDVHELCDAVGRVAEKRAKRPLEATALPADEIETIMFHNRKGIDILDVRDIVYLEGSGSYAKLVMANAAEIKVPKNLKFVFAKLAHRTEFVKVHRSYIVNNKYISNYMRKPKPMLELAGKYQIPVSKEYKQEVLQGLKYPFSL